MDPTYLDQSAAAIDYLLTELLVSPAQRPLISLPVRCQSENLEMPQDLDFTGAGDALDTEVYFL